jgi:ribosome maturation factor RimP
MPGSVEEQVRAIAGRVAQSHGLEVVDVELRGGGKARMLRVYLDKPSAAGTAGGAADSSGITHEDCANFSREFGTILDVEDAMPGAEYTLEVSSSGLDRKLARPRDFERFAGQRVKLVTHEPIAGRRNFEGRLLGLEGERVKLDLNAPKTKAKGKRKKAAEELLTPQEILIELRNLEKANLVPEF